MSTHQSERDSRRHKLENLRAAGLNPYPDRYERSHTLAEAKPLPLGSAVQCAGRLILKRDMGKILFGHLLDWSGQLQIVLDQETLGQDSYKLFTANIDLADFIGVSGEMFQTQKGEISIHVKHWTILAKALQPLPEKWHGLADQEACYRERHLDLIMNQSTRDRFAFRSHFVRALREFYWQNGFMEIDTPVLSPTASGALAKPFITHHNALDTDFFLRIAPETYLKKSTVGGLERVFEIARCFRNEGIDPSHLQDFSMCEHYAVYWNFEDNITFTENLFNYLFEKLNLPKQLAIPDRNGQTTLIDFTTPWPRVSMRELILKDAQIDINDYPTADSLREAIAAHGLQLEDMADLGRGNLIDTLYKAVSRPQLKGPLFLVQHPTDLSPLARRNDQNPNIVDRFQLVINSWEILNAYSELVDPQLQAASFAEQATAKAHGDAEAHGKDDEYIKAMEHGMPPQSGWGMGIERIVSLLTGQNNLKDVVLFPLLRPEGGGAPGALPPALRAESTPLPPRAEALALLYEHVQNPVNRNHAREAEVVMRALAKRLNQDEELWGQTGLLHDIDWEETEELHAEHALRGAKILEQKNYPKVLTAAIRRHNSDLNGSEGPQTHLDYALRCGETVTGLVYAAALVRPDKKLAAVELSSLRKKFKEKSFAAKVNRQTIQECEQLGLNLDEFLALALQAMQNIADEIGV